MRFGSSLRRPAAFVRRIAVLASVVLAGLFFGATAGHAAEVPPTWLQLSAQQQRILAPLKADWPQFNHDRKKKWLEIAARYPAMSPQQQQTLQKRMNEWAHMSPEKRRLARENYLSTAKSPLQNRRQAWEQYNKLPEAERARLKEEARHPKPHPGQVGRYLSNLHKAKPHPAVKATPAAARTAAQPPKRPAPAQTPAASAPVAAASAKLPPAPAKPASASAPPPAASRP